MRRVIRCAGKCNRMVGLYKSYKVHVKDRVTNFLTGEIKTVEYEARMCKDCTVDAGYKK